MPLRSLCSMFIAALLVACAATVQKEGGATTAAPVRIPPQAASKLVLNISGADRSTGASDWAAFKQEWQESFAEQSRLAGITFEMQSGAPKPTGQNGTLVSVYVEDYRFIRPGSRFALGVMTGNAYIESKLTFSDLRTGERFGEQSYNTSSSAWQGIFSAMTNKQVEAIATEVVGQMKARSTSPTPAAATSR